MTSHEDVNRYWDENAENWFKLSNSGVDIVRDCVNTPAFIEMLPNISGQVGLDVGSGDAYNTRLIAQRCSVVEAIDQSSKFIKLARENNDLPNIRFHCVNATHIPFPNEYFDFVVATMTLMDMAEVEVILKEIYRVLSPTGFFQFSILHPCFNDFKGKWLKEGKKYTGFILNSYVSEGLVEIQEWQHINTPLEIPKFKTPRFFRSLSHWITLLLSSGFIIEAIQEPKATEEAIKKYPELAFTHIAPHSLVIRVKKNEEKQSLYKIIKELPGNVWWKGKDLKYLGCNDRVLEVLGLNSRREFIGKTDYDLWESKIAEKLAEADLQVLSTGKTINLEEVIVEHTGKEAVMLTNKSPLLDDEGNIMGILGTSTDITELKQAQQQLKEAQIESAIAKSHAKAEQELRQAITILTGSIAHDLRSPIASMNMVGTALKEKLPFLIQAYHLAGESNASIADKLPSWYIEKFEKLGDTVVDITSQMNQFIDTTLNTIKRTISGELKKEDLTLCDLNSCIQNVLMRYPFLGDERKLVHWDKKHYFKFLGNEILFFRMLSNLLKNSLYQIHQNGRGEIFISAETTETVNRLRFKDTAGGASPEVVSHLFSGYRSTKKEGTGVGLSFCKLTMENFGGSIHCHSVEGDYIEFILEFPR